MKTKLGICTSLLAALLAISLLGLSACGQSATQSSSSSESSSSAASEQEAQEESQAAESKESASGAATSGQQGGGSSKGDTREQESPKAEPSTISVSVSIQSSNAGDLSFGTISRTVTLEPGANAYNALVATGVSVGGSGSYVTSINGLAEKSCGPSSGWTYYVNGAFLSKPANSAKLKNGDSVTWRFVTSSDD